MTSGWIMLKSLMCTPLQHPDGLSNILPDCGDYQGQGTSIISEGELFEKNKKYDRQGFSESGVGVAL